VHGQRRQDRSLRIVLVRHRNAEDRDDRVADELLHRAAVAFDLLDHRLEERREDGPEVLRVELGGEFGRRREVGEQDGDQLALRELGRRGRLGRRRCFAEGGAAAAAEPVPRRVRRAAGRTGELRGSRHAPAEPIRRRVGLARLGAAFRAFVHVLPSRRRGGLSTRAASMSAGAKGDTVRSGSSGRRRSTTSRDSGPSTGSPPSKARSARPGSKTARATSSPSANRSRSASGGLARCSGARPRPGTRQGATGLIQRTSRNRAKSESAEQTVSPCSMASAASSPSDTRFPRSW
jgi:hypothetical protein